MEIRSLDPGDIDAAHDLQVRAFGPKSGDNMRARTLRTVEEGRMLGVYDGPRLIASAFYHALDQWWHGRPVPMGGVAGVCVSPEDRGRGVGRRLAAALLDLMEGRPLSALFPATAPVYRAVGYEHAGAQHLLTLPPEPLRTLAAGPVKVRRAGPADAAEVTALMRRLHAEARHNGPIDRGETFMRQVLEDEKVFAYLADDGFLAYGWDGGPEALAVHRCVAGSPETARALWAVVGSGSSTALTVRACVEPDDPLLWLLRDRSEDEVRRVTWMLRVLDAPAAVAARGFPEGVTAEVSLVVEDETRPRNAGAWRLTVGGGEGRLERDSGAREAVHLPAGGLAALYAGVPVATLRRAGLAAGGEAADPVLDAVFAGTPYMLDYF
ncbi:GNAT family N-acetyltransferase [Actinomadura sp. DC4]|uniref:GNAT family N-acetyltransferase n=1 Tax=Actinomadura sp. DC4 TaxID=3055069 RepID=UPI0025B04C75|nr:GNAT family N-acetyltransferase [Actinomadura sp. DC4]MDN3358026.1 GNAT family N-acetyltransferase [Actinomadura sp. DC4]